MFDIIVCLLQASKLVVIQLEQEKLGQFGFRLLALSSITPPSKLEQRHQVIVEDSTPAGPSPPPPPC